MQVFTTAELTLSSANNCSTDCFQGPLAACIRKIIAAAKWSRSYYQNAPRDKGFRYPERGIDRDDGGLSMRVGTGRRLILPGPKGSRTMRMKMKMRRWMRGRLRKAGMARRVWP